MGNPLIRFMATVAAALTLAVLTASPALAGPIQLSMAQDDIHLIDSPTATVATTLYRFHSLGVQQIRVNLEWWTVAPNPLSRQEPAGFNPADPADYPAANWAPYDRLVQMAAMLGMTVQFNLTSPGPLWAMAAHSPTTRAANHWKPNPRQWLDFVYAVGERYSGAAYGEPRVTSWTLWNEPNQPGWLAPQWSKVKGVEVPQSPRLYRTLAEAGYAGLVYSGHQSDTILFGETAPEGQDSPLHQATPDFYTAMTPLPFLRDVYCLSSSYRPLTGKAAKALGCPVSGSRSRFVADYPVLFRATGYSHHPYDFKHSPTYNWPDSNAAPLADIGRLEKTLDRSLAAYGVHRRLPLYFTEYGYETNPPNPHAKISPAEQAAFLNESDYMAWRNPRVLEVAQYELYDAPPDTRYKPSQYDYWDTFQTGLMYLNGTPKPAYGAYGMEIWIPHPTFRAGASTYIWGDARLTDGLAGTQAVSVRFQAGGRGPWRTVGVAHTEAGYGYLTTRVKLPGAGLVKLVWFGPNGGAQSRTVAVSG